MITIGSLNLFHDFMEIHEYLSSLPVLLLYQYQGQLISINNYPVLRVIIYHDIHGNSILDYQRIR